MKRLLLFLLILILAALLALAVLYFTGNLPQFEAVLGPLQQKTLGNDPDCSYTWASQPLPELTAELQKKLIKLDVRASEVNAAAYGENCVLADGTVGRFITRQTDLYFMSPVTDFEDRELLGSITEEIILFARDIPEGTLPGPQEGFIQINFISADGKMQSLWFQGSDGLAYLDEGLKGAELYKKLFKK